MLSNLTLLPGEREAPAAPGFVTCRKTQTIPYLRLQPIFNPSHAGHQRHCEYQQP